MTTRLWAATDAGLVELRRQGDGWVAVLRRAVADLRAVAVDPSRPERLFLGAMGGGVILSEDGGERSTAAPLPEKDVLSLAVSPADGTVYAGTEPSRLFRSRDGGRSWTELEALRSIPSAPTWSFPPRPWTSHVSAIAPHPHDPLLLLVGIELGGLMRSGDGGATWDDHRPGAQRDVHALLWHPTDPERAYEAGGGGAASSHDRGRTWTPADRGRDRDYTWVQAVDPGPPTRWYLAAAPSARHAHHAENAAAHLYRRVEDGPWERLRTGLPDPLPHLPRGLVVAGARLITTLGDGTVYESEDAGSSWRRVPVSGASLRGVRVLVEADPD